MDLAEQAQSRVEHEYSGTYAYWGPPGTGKTTTLAAQVNAIVLRTAVRTDNTSPVVICSLTRAAAAEIADPRRGIKIPKWQIGTLHAHAYRMLGSPEIAETHIDEWNALGSGFSLDDGSRLDTDDYIASSDRSTVKPNGGEALASEYAILRTRMTPRSSWRLPVVRFADRWEAWKAKTGYIDFCDMIEMALNECDHAPGAPDVLIVDEAQDHGIVELELCRKWGKAAGELILAGDPYQSIYCWRGADPSFMMNLPANRIKVLSQSYRVPLKVRDISMKWLKMYLSNYRDILYEPRYRDDDKTQVAVGELGRVRAPYTSPGRIVKALIDETRAGRSVMVCATCGYMLNPILSELRDKGLPFSNPWRTKRGDWNPIRGANGTSMRDRIIAFLHRDEQTFPITSELKGDRAHMWTGEELEQWASCMPSKTVIRHGAKKLLVILSRDKKYEAVTRSDLEAVFTPDALLILESLFNLNDNSRGGQTARLIEWFEAFLMGSKRKAAVYPLAVFRREGVDGLLKSPKIYIGTIHSFKGAEADTVIVIPDLSPAGCLEWRSGRGEKRDAVVRCFYVAMTRARERLLFCDAATGYSVPL